MKIGTKRWYEDSLVFLLYLVLTVAMMYPAVMFLNTKVLGGPGDNFHFLWELWYVAHALFDLHKSPFFDPDVFVPFGFSLIRNQDLSPGTVLLFSPITYLCGEVFTYNFLILLSFPLTALGSYLLARELWKNRAAAILAGVIIGFCPYRFVHSGGHLSVVSTQWIPFFFLYLERLISKPRAKNAIMAGVFFGLSAWATWYYFFMVPIAAVAYTAFRVDWRAPQEERVRMLRSALLCFVVAVAFVLPFLIPYYLATHGGVVDKRGAGESQALAASVADYVIPPTTHVLWGQKARDVWRKGANGIWQSEWQLYLGVVALLLAAAGIFHPRRRVIFALVAMALVCLLFSFGPGIYVTHPAPLDAGTNDVALSVIPAPGRWLRELPGFNNLRSWARLGFFVEMAVGLLAAAGLAHLLDWTKERHHAKHAVQIAVAVIVTSLAVLDFFPGPVGMTSVTPRSADRWLAAQPGNFAFIDYPIPRHGYGGPAIYTTRLTGKRIIMGSSQSPPNAAFWEDLSAFPSPWTLDLLAGWGAKYVLVDENLYRAGVSFWNIYQTWNTLETAIKQNPHLKEVAVLDGVHVYAIENSSHAKELFTNGSFEEGKGRRLPGWKILGKPKLDRTSKYSFGGRAACALTGRDFLVSTPVRVEPGECYRLGVRDRANSSKRGTLHLQVHWKGENNHDVDAPTKLVASTRSGPHWQESTLIARAPVGSKYAVVSAKAAGAMIWVDDYSLKKIAKDCEAELFITPNPVSISGEEFRRVSISWTACCNSEARVTFTSNGSIEQPFASGQSGLGYLDHITAGTQYTFRLYSQQQPDAVKTASLSTTQRTATISANPNPVPPGSGPGRTRIYWSTLTGEDGEIFASQDSGPEQLFARGASGYADANWILAGGRYEFRLYTTSPPRRLLAKTVVTR